MDNHRNDGEAVPGASRPGNHESSPQGRSRRIEAPKRSSRRLAGVVSGNVDTNMSIPLSNLHRRQSRENCTDSGDEDIYHPREQEAALLTPGNNVRREAPSQHEAQGTYRRRLRGFSSDTSFIFGVLLAFLALLYLSYYALSESFPNHPSSNLDSGSSDGTLAILLHPEDHVYRRPTQQTHYWNVTSKYRSPDGVLKKIYLINGQFPGPLIECRAGDRLTIHVTNQLDGPEDRISIHWHGLNMRGANAMDGASDFTQCSIPPNGTFTYDFEIDSESVGTFWYHAHSSVQRGDGMYGGLVVHDAKDRTRDLSRYRYEKEVLLLIGDWYHRSATEVLDWYMSVRAFKNEVCSSPAFAQ